MWGSYKNAVRNTLLSKRPRDAKGDRGRAAAREGPEAEWPGMQEFFLGKKGSRVEGGEKDPGGNRCWP